MTAGDDPRRRPSWREALAARPGHVLVWALAAGLAGAPAALALVAALGLRALRVARPPLALAAAAALLAGGAAADARTGALERHDLPLGADVAGRATVLAAPRTDERGGLRALAALRLDDGRSGRVLLRAEPPLALPPSPGRIAVVSGRLRPPDRGAQAVHAHATLQVREARATGARRGGVSGMVDRVRDRAAAALAHGLPAADGALLQGMVLGQDAALPEDLRDDLRAAGLAHLVAASGQNVLLLAALGLAVGALLGLPIRPRLVLVAGLVVLYVPLAGAGPSIQRAGVMGVASLAAAFAGRPSARWHAVGLAAVATLLLDPRATTDPGWQMSFAAVVALALLAAPLTARLRDRGVPRGAAEALAVAVVATVATAPVAAWHFGRVGLVAVPANVAVTPAVAPVMWAGMAAAAVAQVWPGAAAVPVAFAAPLVAFVRWIGTAAAGLPGAETQAPPGLVAATAAAVLVPLALVARRHLLERRALEDEEAGLLAAAPPGPLRPRWRAALVVLGTVVLAGWLRVLAPGPVVPPPGPGVLRVAFLDVGQGDATLVQAGGAAVLVDAGPPGAPVARHLRRFGVRRLDALVVTHDALDHHGSAVQAVAAAPPRLLLDGGAPARLRAAAARRVAPAAGQTLRLGPLTLRVLWPPATPAEPGADPNDRAVVLEAEAGGTRVLLPADAESPVLGGADLRAAHVLKVGHHGSADDGLGSVLARVAPRVAVISAGAGNRHGHPAPATLAALARLPRVLRTDRDGTVVVEGRAGRLHVGTGP